MQLGWIDFSKSEKNKVLNVLELLGEKGVLDELGIAPIRDGFSNLFFPGITTIQTRAKYFLIVPYALKDLELNKTKNINELIKILDDTEKKCAKIFLKNNSLEQGVIGTNALKQNNWVKRKPSNIYWTGLKQYQIFTGEKLSITEYIKYISYQKNKKEDIKKFSSTTNKNDDKNDVDLYKISNIHFLNLPTYKKNWINNLKMDLNYNEAIFLKNQILNNCNGSLIAFILENNLREILEFNSFNDLENIMFKFPSDIQEKFYKAKDFSDFNLVLSIIYNLIVSEDDNKKAKKLFNQMKPRFKELSQINLDVIFKDLEIYNYQLKSFLYRCRLLMGNYDIDGLKKEIKNREILLKGENRAKTCHCGEFKPDEWFSSTNLDYRFTNAKIIIKDIFEGCDQNA